MKLFKTPSRIMTEEFKKTIGDLKLEKDGNKTMTITIYELLGLVKDGKAPKKIKYINDIWEYNEKTKDYNHDDLWLFYSMNGIGLTECKVEILEEENKIEKEELFTIDETMTKASLVAWQKANNGIFKKKIDELIDEINKLKESKNENN